MKHEPITGSSNIKAAGYDEDTSVLEIVFRNGGIYRYIDVPGVVYLSFMKAPSKGKFLAEHLKNKYEFEKVK